MMKLSVCSVYKHNQPLIYFSSVKETIWIWRLQVSFL
jgi:hypothetical protein